MEDDLLEILVAYPLRYIHGDRRVVGGFNSRHADRMGSTPENLLQVPRMLHQRQHLEAVIGEAEEYSEPHVADTGFHGPVKKP